MNDAGILIILSGPSGSGKDTVLKELLKLDKDTVLSISSTTRKPRDGEIDGVDYNFLEVSEFKELIENDGVLEYAQYCDNFYGTPRKFVENTLDSGQNIILEIEVQGALQVKEKFNDCVLIFLMPPSFETLKQRLSSRGTEEETVILNRLEVAKSEMKQADKYDYIVVNDEVENAVMKIISIIKADKCRYKRNIGFINSVII